MPRPGPRPALAPLAPALRLAFPRALSVALFVALSAGSPAGHAGPDVPRADPVRGLRGIDQAVDFVVREAKRRGAVEVLVVFDQITFDPPPGRNEYRADADYAGDLDGWLDALRRQAGEGKVTLRVAATLDRESVAVGDEGWREALAGALKRPWWSEAGFPGFEPALAWLRRLAPRGRSRRAPGMVVLIASEMTPERWVGGGGAGGGNEAWRRRLLPVGSYWDAERIGRTLSGLHDPLTVITPEVRFGDEVPRTTRPDLPWTARPQRPPPALYGVGDPGSGEDAYDRLLRQDLDRDLAGEIPDAIERKRRIDELLGVPPKETRTQPGDAPPSDTTDRTTPGPGGRFTSGTPALFPHQGGVVLFNDDVPSGFGYWPYARAARLSGGRLLLYPFPPGAWLDVCPRDEGRMRALAPELVDEATWVGRRAGDPALDALCRAAALVTGATPWGDQGTARLAGGWSAFASTKPLRETRGYRMRRKPVDPFLTGRARALRPVGERLARLLPRYDRALAVLDAALARVRAGKDTRSAPRSVADLRLGRFEFAMSAFHLQALSLALREMERLVPASWDEAKDTFSITHHRVVKLSDCLDAYDGRALGPAEESHYPRLLQRAWLPPGWEEGRYWEPGQVIPGQQGNLLSISPTSPDYRAKRDLDAVLRYLDPRLGPRALDLIEAAREVMKHDARTPWGWTVYYAEVLQYLFDPVNGAPDRRPRPGEDEKRPQTPWTPTPRGGSTPGGPVTPR